MDAKSFITSKTIWGAIVMIAATFFPVLFTHMGSTPDAGTQESVTQMLVSAVGFALAVYGRWNANKPLSLSGGSKKS